MKKRLIKLITKLLKKEEITKPNIEYKLNNDTNENSQITIITKHFEELYNNINIGDIYFAYMPLVKEELDAIEETHRRRPYVIVKKENGKVYGYACYGKKYSWLKSNEYFHLDNRIYDVNKDGYIVLDEIFEIPLENIIRYYLTLSPKTIRDIEKRILITNNQRTPLPTFEIGYDIEIGDIFLLDKQLYYVYQKDNTHIYTHKVFKNQHIDNIKLVRIRVDNKDYFISYLKQEQFSSKEQY